MYYIAFGIIASYIIQKIWRKFFIDQSDPYYRADKDWSDEMNGL